MTENGRARRRMDLTSVKKWTSDVRFWILVFFIIRLVGITNAPLEVAHNWRQSHTNMVARNFDQVEFNVFYPRVDTSGSLTGITGSEFPIFNVLIHLVTLIFGYDHWYGRLINLIISSLGIFFFFKVTRDLISQKVAFYATIVLLVSIWFSFSRKTMPDTFSVSMVLIGIYFGIKYIKHGHWPNLIGFFLLVCLGLLSKIPSGVLLASGIVIPLLKVNKSRLLALSLSLMVSIVIVWLWYFNWVPYLAETYRTQLYFPRTISQGFNELLKAWPELLARFYHSALLSYVAFCFLLYGILRLVLDRRWLEVLAFSSVSIVFSVFIIKAGEVFALHNYYIIPYAPIMAIVVGFGLSRVSNKWQIPLLVIISLEAILNQQHDFFIKDRHKYKLQFEKIADKHLPKDELVIVNGGRHNPQTMYFLNRRGWTLDPGAIVAPRLIDSLRKEGAKHLFWDKNLYKEVQIDYPISYSDKHVVIFDLEEESGKNKHNL